MADCYDLDDQKKWRVFMAEDHVKGSPRDPWNKELRGRLGHAAAIYPYGEGLMAATVDRIRKRETLEGLGRVIQDGDTEVTVVFPVERLNEVATLLRCYVKKGPPARPFLPGYDDRRAVTSQQSDDHDETGV